MCTENKQWKPVGLGGCSLGSAFHFAKLFPLLGKRITLSTGSASLKRSSNTHHCSSRPPRVSVVCLHLRSSHSGPALKILTAPWVPLLGNPISSILLHFQVYVSILYSLASSSVSTFPWRHWIVKIEGAGGKSRNSLSNLFGSPCLCALLPQLSRLSSSQASLSTALWTQSIFLQG